MVKFTQVMKNYTLRRYDELKGNPNRFKTIQWEVKQNFNVIIWSVDVLRGIVKQVRKEIKSIQSLPPIADELQVDLKAIVDEDLKGVCKKKEQVETKSKYKDLLIRFNTVEEQLETITNVKEHKPKFLHIDKSDEASEATAVWVASDWHIDEIVDPDTINQMNEYNPKIAEERAKNFFKNWLRLTDILSKDIKIEHILLAVLWDMISGYIHPELIENNSDSPTQALIRFRNILISWIDYIIENSNYKLTLVCKMWNHWRTTEKKMISSSYKNSYEWLIYHLIADTYKDNPRVNFIVENGYHTYFKIYDYMLRMHHWDAMRFWWGVWGLTIPVNKSISQWNKWRNADIEVFWHFHTMMFHKNFVSNGSLIWYNAYAESIKADFEKPAQAFFLVDKKRGKTIQAPISLD